MKLQAEDTFLEKGFSILEKSFDFRKVAGTVYTKQVDRLGFRILKSGEDYTVEYRRNCDFFNALGLLAATGKEYSKRIYAPYTGVMLDCARDGVPTVEFLREYIEIAALSGYNYIGLYLEDLLEVDDEPYFGYKRGRYTADEIKAIVEYAEIFGIEIVPYIQTLAHLNAIFRWYEYKPINDITDILLVGEERTYTLIENMVKTCARIFKSSRINVGMDEAFTLGGGKYLKQFGYKKPDQILYEHLAKVLDITEKYGLQAEMWSPLNEEKREYFEAHRAELEPLLRRVRLCSWGYDATDSEIPRKKVAYQQEFTDEISYGAGSWTWVGLTPLNKYSHITTKAVLDACRKQNVKDVFFCCWQDVSGECSFLAVAPSLITNTTYFLDEKDADVDNDMAQFLYGYTYEELMYMDAPNSVKEVSRNNIAYLLFHNDPLQNLFGCMAADRYAEQYRDIAAKLKALSLKAGRIAYVYRTLYELANCLEVKATLGNDLKQAYKDGDREEMERISRERIPLLITRIDSFCEAMQEQWLREKKSNGYDNVNIKLGAMVYQLKYTQDIISRYLKGEMKVIAEYEEADLKVFPWLWVGETDQQRHENYVTFTNWDQIISTTRLFF